MMIYSLYYFDFKVKTGSLGNLTWPVSRFSVDLQGVLGDNIRSI